MIDKKNLAELFAKITEYWQPHIIGELNGQYVKAAKFYGHFPMHSHENEDEMFLVIKGRIEIEFENYNRTLSEGELIVVPKGTLHSPSAKEEAHVLLFEPMQTLNTGNVENEFTHKNLKKL